MALCHWKKQRLDSVKLYVKVLQQKPLHYMESKTQNLPGRDGHKLYFKKSIKREGEREREGESL